MNWQTLNVDDDNLSSIYNKKYGKSSDFQNAQKIMYSHPEIKASFFEALSWMTIKPDDCILDIGVNNGYELTLIEDYYGKELMSRLNLIGFDLIEDVLIEACDLFVCNKKTNFKFIKGDIRNLSGIDIVSREMFDIKDDSLDAVIALTSLQSSMLVSGFDHFIEKLVLKIKSNGCLFVAVPNCHVGNSGEIIKGMFNAKNQNIDLNAAEAFTVKLSMELKKYGFNYKKTGEFYFFIYFSR